MAADAPTPATSNGTHPTPQTKPLELALTLPHNPGLRIHLHLTLLASSLTLFLTSNTGGGGGGAAMGSLIFAMPDRYNPTTPLSTPLYTLPSSQDFATRMARVLAGRLKRPVYVGSSVEMGGPGGATVEEEMEVFGAVVGVVGRAVEGG